MVNKPRRKGTRWETDAVNYLHEEGLTHAHRNPLSSPFGDIGGVDGFIIEAKDHQEITLAAFIDQATKSSRDGELGLPVVLVRRRRKGVRHGYAIMPLWAFVKLLRIYLRRVGNGDDDG